MGSRVLTYKAAGVNRDVVGAALDAMREQIRGTFTPAVLGDLGHFGGLFRMAGYRDPVLVSSIDGVGTKVVLAREAGRLDVAGHDAVVHGVNDVAVLGAQPLFVLDYVAAAQLEPGEIAAILAGAATACREDGVALIGGETAQMPGVYTAAGLDVVACVVGVVERDRIRDGSTITPGDVAIAFRSAGLHTNGYSLARAVLAARGWSLDTYDEDLGTTLGAALLAPHRSYRQALGAVAAAGWLHGAAHITGGGIAGNLVRILPEGCRARIDTSTWQAPPIFDLIARGGDIPREEMFATFNMGVGMIAVVPADHAADAVDLSRANGTEGWVIGEIVAGDRGVDLVDARLALPSPLGRGEGEGAG